MLESYLAKLDNPDHRFRMEELFKWVLQTFPTLEPKIAWNQPMFTDHGTFIIGFSTAKHHLSVAPEEACMQHFADELANGGYDHTKGLIRFKWSSPIDYELLQKMIAFNIQDKADCTTFWRK